MMLRAISNTFLDPLVLLQSCLFTCSGVGVMGESPGRIAGVGRGVTCWLRSPR